MRNKHFAFPGFSGEGSTWAHHGAWRFGRGGFGFRGFAGAWGRATRRGDVKYLVLEVLAQGPCHGYDIITRIEGRYGFRPSAGSIYPTLQMLEDGGYVTGSQEEGKRVYTITDSGRQLLEKRPAGDEADDVEEDPRYRVRAAAKMLMMAVWGARGTSDPVLDKVAKTLERARKEIYSILSGEAE